MSSSYEPLLPARPVRNAAGRLMNAQYGDIYHAGAQPFAQAQAVFLKGNGLPERWRGARQFTVLETGFGLGLNFLALWRAWRDDPQRCARLHMVSVEAHPLSRADLAAVLAGLDAPYQPLARALLREWPLLLPGLHRLEFEGGALTLTLAFGSISRLARQLDLGFDACFLDGFSPAVNPDMWTPRVFGQLARLARPGATLASWCSAGQVRRDLQDAGFLVRRLPGFGRKRHMISGELRPGMGRTRPRWPGSRILVVGAGFAGAAIAHRLALHGHPVRVFDPALAQGPSGTHHGHRLAVLSPSLSRDDDIRTRLSRAGAELARRRWRALPLSARPWPCGLFEPIAQSSQAVWQAALARLAFPQDWVRWLDDAQAAERTGMPDMPAGLWHARAQLVLPEAFQTALLSGPGIDWQAETVGRLSCDDGGVWTAWDGAGRALAQGEHVVLANAWKAVDLLAGLRAGGVPARMASMRRLAGQLSYFERTQTPGLRCIVAGRALCMPDGSRGLVAGSTYVPDATLSIITLQGHHENQQNAAESLNVLSSQLGQPASNAWAGWRAAVRDRLPVIGAAPGCAGLWLACGFGSRGLVWSALAAELLAAWLNDEPVALERELSRKLAP